MFSIYFICSDMVAVQMEYPRLRVPTSVGASNALMVRAIVPPRVMKPCMVVAQMDSLLHLVPILLAVTMIQVSVIYQKYYFYVDKFSASSKIRTLVL